MSRRRQARLAALALLLIGGALTTVQFTGTFDFGEGSLWLPAAAAGGLGILIALRPRTNPQRRSK